MNAATYAVSAVVLLRIVTVAPAAADAAAERRPWWERAAEGVGIVARTPLLRLMASVQALAALSAGATSALLIVLATDHLGVDADGFGLLLAAIGVGAATGPLVLSRFVSDPRRLGFVFGPFLLRGAVDLVLAATRSLPVAMGALRVYGVGTSTGMVTFNSLLGIAAVYVLGGALLLAAGASGLARARPAGAA